MIQLTLSRPYISVVFLFLLLLSSCRKTSDQTAYDEINNPFITNSVDRDWEDIKKDGVLKALVVYSSTSYFLYKGEPMGFEYELLQQLAKELNLKLELVVSKDLDTEFEVLNRGDVDLIAHGMTVTKQRQWEVDFTEYLFLTKQVLVQKKPDNYLNMSWKTLEKSLIQDPIELINDTISIRKNSAYFERLLSLSNEIGGDIVIDTLDSNLSTGEIIHMVSDGTVKYTIADENLAKINASDRPNLDIRVPISFSQRISWVTRKKSPEFKEKINQWILSQRKTKNFNVIYNKYFKNKRMFKNRSKSEYYSLANNQISAYDKYIKSHAKKIDWDWRLLASQVYQESKFDPKARSWTGAQGLMQLMPRTAASLEVKDPTHPEESLRAGTTYLKQIYNQFENIPDSINRIKFTMAAYNCGFGHIADAQRLAKANNLNPNLWQDNVDQMLLALSLPTNYTKEFIKYGYVRGAEPVNYVNQILDRYDQYKQFVALE